MRQSKLFIPTLKETPADATVASHVLLLRGGYVRALAAGIYSYLPLFQRVLRKVEAIVREEMAAIGAQEFFLPALHPAELWRESGRWDVMGDNLFRLKDRGGRELCLGMTHEEIFTSIARDELRSYRQLPQVWYQIQTKFRDEPRPKSGVLRVRQFTMKDAYSFDLDRAGLDRSFEAQHAAYVRIFQRCGLAFVAVDAHSGAMGGGASTEFMVRTDAGEDDVVACPRCGYAANVERAESRGTLAPADPGAPGEAPTRFPTPGVKTIEDLANAPYLRPAARQLKTLVYVADERLVLAIVRGDDELNEAKLQTALAAQLLRPAHPEEIQAALDAKPGSLGGVGVAVGTTARVSRLVVDASLKGLTGMVTGANADGFHLEGVAVDRDLCGTVADLRRVRAGERCARCESGVLDAFKALEVGHIFKLGTKYSEALGARVLDALGKEVPLIMGSYGIGVERIAAAAVELHHDRDGIRWPLSIAPFQLALLPLQTQDAVVLAAAERLYAALEGAGIEVLLDDRDERPGVKFKDADLIGIPFRVAIGRKSLAEGKVEWKPRGAAQAELVALDEVLPRIRRELGAA